MGEIQCFWTEPTGRVKQSLRRFVHSTGTVCTGRYGYHNAETRIEDAPASKDAEGYIRSPEPSAFAGDPRWPTHCECGYKFQDADEWQVFVVSIYRCPADGREWPLRDLPPGAMYDATWYHQRETAGWVGDDGIALVVVLPPQGVDNWWHVDGRASNNPAPRGWTRTGTVPNITATPSILTKQYHGWLRDGKLVEC